MPRFSKRPSRFSPKKGIDLEIVVFDDYVQPNLQLEAGDLDANYFQHIPYLEDFNAQNGTHLVSAGAVHYEPMGLYVNPAKAITLDSIPDGATIAIPNDTTNESARWVCWNSTACSS